MAGESTFTFLFTDIEGSTRRWEQQPEAMRSALERHNSILHDAVESQRGQVYKSVGDGLCAYFSTAPAALTAAVAAQKALFHEPWELEEPLQVRVVLHTGAMEVKEGDFFGSSLNRLGRMLQVCHGGQTLLTMAAEEMVRDHLPEEISLLDLGQHRFRDLVNPERIFQVVIPGLPDRFPPLASLDAIPNNLPIQPTRFIGRQAELQETLRLLSDARLVTLTGMGGTGKTRLALQAAAEAVDLSSFPDGAWLIELAPIASPDLVLPAAANVLNVREPPGRPLQTSINDFLSSKSLLLVLDNCEHLLDSCGKAVAGFLQAGRGVKILTTSREPLGVASETIFRVPSLPLPDPGASFEDSQQNEALQLFVERAKAVKADFSLTPQNVAAVIQICRRLDGIPLAIELAAARVSLFSPSGIAARLDDRFRLLTGGRRSTLPHQQTLEALIDWSYDLLSEDERRLFRALAVFSSGFSYEAAEFVFDEDVLGPLAQLVDKSLVLVEENEEDATRYRLLETIRQYAQAKLAAAGEVETIRDRHLEYFIRYSKDAEAQLEKRNRQRWLDLLNSEKENLRSAIEWGLERWPAEALAVSGEQAFFWGQHGYTGEAIHWLEQGIEKILPQQESGRDSSVSYNTILAKANWGIGVLESIRGKNPLAASALEKSVKYWREVGDSHGLSRSLSWLGFQGGFMSLPNPYRASAEEGLALGRRIHYPEAISIALTALGAEETLHGEDYGTAKKYFEEALVEMQQEGDMSFSGNALLGLGFVAQYQGDYHTAGERYAESMSVFEDNGDSYFVNVSRSGLADVARLDKDFPRAIKLYLETIKEWQKLDNLGAVIRCLECLAFINGEQAQAQSQNSVRQGFIRRAGVLFGAAEILRQSNHSEMNQIERAEYVQNASALRSFAAAEELEAAWRQGSRMSIDEAVAFAGDRKSVTRD